MNPMSNQPAGIANQPAPDHANQTAQHQSKNQQPDANIELNRQMEAISLVAIGQTGQSAAPQTPQRQKPLPDPAAFGPEPHLVRPEDRVLGPQGAILKPPSIKRERELGRLILRQQAKADAAARQAANPAEFAAEQAAMQARIAARQANLMAALGLTEDPVT